MHTIKLKFIVSFYQCLLWKDCWNVFLLEFWGRKSAVMSLNYTFETSSFNLTSFLKCNEVSWCIFKRPTSKIRQAKIYFILNSSPKIPKGVQPKSAKCASTEISNQSFCYWNIEFYVSD